MGTILNIILSYNNTLYTKNIEKTCLLKAFLYDMLDIIKVAGKSELEKTITVRRKIGAFGVEKIFAVHSSTIEKIEVLRQFKVRRKSIKFIRELTGKAARLKEIKMSKDTLNAPRTLPTFEAPKVEAPKAQEEAPAEEVKAEEK